jgi:hypothetical protein
VPLLQLCRVHEVLPGLREVAGIAPAQEDAGQTQQGSRLPMAVADPAEEKEGALRVFGRLFPPI